MTTKNILQVSELTKKVRFILESELNTVWLCGEISNFIAASSGHWYLSLKDSKSQVKCAMFKGNNRRARITPKNGQQVLVRAKVSLYEPRGDFQLIIEHMDDAGAGLLQQQFEQLKNNLAAQGLFDQYLKQPIPRNITRVGIVTSPTGAAITDILTVLQRRNPSIKVIIYPSLVQGDMAADNIVHAINTANFRNECDVLIVGRGGGSKEDLWCFNEEKVVRAIFESTLPTISAVGHEIDTTLSDYSADLRAPTPSAAAELVSEDSSELNDKIIALQQRLTRSLQHRFKAAQHQHATLFHRLSREHPAQQLRISSQKHDELDNRLRQLIVNKQSTISTLPEQLHKRLLQCSPCHTVANQQQQVTQLIKRIKNTTAQQMTNKKERFVNAIDKLQLVSPLATIARGYAIARDDKSNIVNSVNDVNVDDILKVQIADGEIITKVINQ